MVYLRSMREREVLKLLTQSLAVGDDCAVIEWGRTNLVFTTDMLHQATDFPEGTTPYTIGWRSVAVSLSDIAAMGAKPLAVVMALGAPEFGEKFVEELLAGIRDCCETAGARHVGGDLDHHEELTLVSSAIGEVERPILRRGARAGELVCVTGALGRSATALKLFKRGKVERANRLFCFLPRVREGQAIGGYATSMMDISDGLARSLYQLGEASNVGFRIDYEKVPILAEVQEIAHDEKEELEMALYTGEDFELLFTLPQHKLEEAGSACDFTAIGEVTKQGIFMECGGLTELEDRGFEH